MKKLEFAQSQIEEILKQQIAGRTVTDICSEYGVNKATFYKWKSKYLGMDCLNLKCLKELEKENIRLSKMCIESSKQNKVLKDLLCRNDFVGS